MFPSDFSYFHRPQSHLENSSTSYPLAVAILLHYYPSPLILAFSSYIKLPPTLSSYITRSLKLQFISASSALSNQATTGTLLFQIRKQPPAPSIYVLLTLPFSSNPSCILLYLNISTILHFKRKDDVARNI